VLQLYSLHEKLLDSDWLRAVQFKCNTGAQNICEETLKKVFSIEKNGFKRDLSELPPREFSVSSLYY